MLFFNVQMLLADETIGHVLGEYWRDVITKGKSTYWNCNGNKDDYRNLAIGMVHHDDDDAWRTLDEIARSLTQLDYLITLKSDLGWRCFGPGGAPKQADVRRGRPRSVCLVRSHPFILCCRPNVFAC